MGDPVRIARFFCTFGHEIKTKEPMKGRIVFWLIGTAIYPLLIYVFVPWTAHGLAVVSGSLYGSILVFVVLLVAELLLFHSLWRTLVVTVLGLLLTWGGYLGYQLWEDTRMHPFADRYPSGQVEREGHYQGTSCKLHGKVTTYYEDGGVKSVGTYRRGFLNGPCRQFYEDGKLKAEGDWVTDPGSSPVRDGVWRYYRESGVLDDKRKYRKGELVASSNYTLRFDDDRRICRIADGELYTGTLDKIPVVMNIKEVVLPYRYTCSVEQGYVREGEVVVYYEQERDPAVKATYTYAGGVQHGSMRYYYPNSQLASECTYREGRIEGDYFSYHADSVASRPHGQVKYSCFYLNDKRNGVAYWYNADGSPDSQQPHRHGQRSGVVVRWSYAEEAGDFEGVNQTLYIDDEPLHDLVTESDYAAGLQQVDLENSDKGFAEEFGKWRKIDTSWLLMERTLERDKLVSRLHLGMEPEQSYALLRSKVLPGGMSLPETLPDGEDEPASFRLPAGGGAHRIEVCKSSNYQTWYITVESTGQTVSYELSDATNGSWLKVTTTDKND